MKDFEKEFVPYAPSLRLKVLGFDEPCLAFYYDKTKFLSLGEKLEYLINKRKASYIFGNDKHDVTLAPTFSQAFRWFRDKYNVVYEIIRKEDGNHSEFIGWVYINNRKIDVVSYWDSKTYEKAELACLEKLLEIVESKSE